MTPCLIGNDERVHRFLKKDLEAAEDRLNVASAAFDVIVQEGPDAALWIYKASRAHTQARHDLKIAVRRLNAFIAKGEVPDDFR